MEKKYYRFLYLTDRKDVIREEVRGCYDIKEARKIASHLVATTSHNDLHRIEVRRDQGKNFKAYVASNIYTKAFDSCRGYSARSAIAALKRKYSANKKDYVFWAVYVYPNGGEEKQED